MKDEPSIVARTERTIDDLRALCRRRKPLCLLVVVILVFPTLLWIFEHFWGRAVLESQIESTKNELADVKHDRDVKATQLAPFLALANSRYENAPEGKRLEFLLDRLESLTQTLLQIAKPSSEQASKKRALSPDSIKRIQAKLDFAKAVPISIVCPVGVDETNDLAGQLRKTFEAAGFQVSFSMGLFQQLPVGVMVRAKPPLSPEVEDALLMVFKELGEKPQFYQATDIIDSSVSIVVGARPSPPPTSEPQATTSPGIPEPPHAAATPWLTIETKKP